MYFGTLIVIMFLTLNVDEDEYPVPADGRVENELQDAIQEYVYDIDGVTVKTIKTIKSKSCKEALLIK